MLEMIRLWNGHPARKTPRFLASDYKSPTELWDHPRADAPSIELHSFADVELRSDHMPYSGNAPILDERLYPSYVAHYYAEGLVDAFGFPSVEAIRAIDQPIFCITHFNMLTYGHFLFEVLPKLLICRRLRASGLSSARIAFPMNTMLGSIIQTICDPNEILVYDDSSERLRVPVALVPSVGSSLEFHDLVVEDIVRLAADIDSTPSGKLPGPRIFLSRARVGRSYRRLTNEAQLFEVAAEFGFELVFPEDLLWGDQVRMFQRATYVIGEYTSALHGTMFCRQDTKIVSLGWLQYDLQSYIAAAFGHEIGYILPKDGKIPEFKPGWIEVQTFEISPDDLRDCLELICSN